MLDIMPATNATNITASPNFLLKTFSLIIIKSYDAIIPVNYDSIVFKWG